jgi:hypothetical protein
VKLEEEWGDHLVQQKQLDAAINHFIEAGYVFGLDAFCCLCLCACECGLVIQNSFMDSKRNFFKLSAEKCIKPSSRETSSLLEARIVKRRLSVVHSPTCGVGLLEKFSIEV